MFEIRYPTKFVIEPKYPIFNEYPILLNAALLKASSDE